MAKDLNFELNLVPMIDVFSACICFLLMTVVWVQIGVMQVNQSMGAQALSANPPSISVTIFEDGALNLSFDNSQRAQGSIKITKNNLTKLEDTLTQVFKKVPELKTVLILPHAKSNYQEILNLMDRFRRHGIKDIGITPL